MATFEYKSEHQEGQNPVDAVAKPIAYGGLFVLVAVVIIVGIVIAIVRGKKKTPLQ